MDTSKLWVTLSDYEKSYVIATVCDAKTSSYRNIGESYSLDSEGQFIGKAEGDYFEFLLTNMRVALRRGKSFLKTYIQHRSDAASSGATCGERTTVFFQYTGVGPVVMIFGAGNLGFTVAKILVTAGYNVRVLDDDPGFLRSFEGVADTAIISFDDRGTYPEISDGDLCLVLTRGHMNDFNVLRVILKKSPLYIGMVGSEKKNDEVKVRLLESGFDEEQWQRIKTPVGIDIGASTPGEIAVAIAAEVVGARNGKI